MLIDPSPPTAFAAMLGSLAKAARSAAARPVKRGARLLLAEPWRLDRLAPGLSNLSGQSAVAIVRARKNVMRDLGIRGHHGYEANRMLALRQAYVALRAKRLGERRRSDSTAAATPEPVTMDAALD